MQEVEADKQNAAKLNALVQITSPTDNWPIGRRSSPDNHGTSRFSYSEKNRSQLSNSSPDSSAKCNTFGEVRKLMPGCLQHYPVVQFIYTRYPCWLNLFHFHGSWLTQLFSQTNCWQTKSGLLLLFRKVYRSGNTVTRDLEVPSSNLGQDTV